MAAAVAWAAELGEVVVLAVAACLAGIAVLQFVGLGEVAVM